MSGSARELLIRGDIHQDLWLSDYLAHQARSATQCIEEALAAGFTKKQSG
jgi:hypothetical protein